MAIFSDKHVLLYDLITGQKVADLDSAAQHCRGLCFTPDGSELAGLFFDNRHTKVLSWTMADRKQVVSHSLVGDYKHVLKGAFSYKGPAIDVLPDGSAFLLYGHGIVDRASGRLVWMIEDSPADFNPVPRRLLDNDHVTVAAGSSQGERRLAVLRLPWAKIDASLKALAAGAEAHVKPGQSVSLHVEVAAVRAGSPDETKADLVKALTERLEGDGFKVADGQPVTLSVRYNEEAGATLNEMASQGGRGPGGSPAAGPFGNTVATGKTIQGTKAFCEASLQLAGSKEPLWSTRIESDPHHLIVHQDASDAAARSATYGMMKTNLTQQLMPYFVPKDDSLASLPGTTVLKGKAESAPQNRATPKPTRRGK